MFPRVFVVLRRGVLLLVEYLVIDLQLPYQFLAGLIRFEADLVEVAGTHQLLEPLHAALALDHMRELFRFFVFLSNVVPQTPVDLRQVRVKGLAQGRFDTSMILRHVDDSLLELTLTYLGQRLLRIQQLGRRCIVASCVICRLLL